MSILLCRHIVQPPEVAKMLSKNELQNKLFYFFQFDFVCV